MADVYELNTIADLLKVPIESLDACLRDLRYALELCHFAGGEDTSTMAFDSFAWTDDGRHDIDMSMNGEPFLKLNVTDEAALSHAAGQDGEQCRAASGEPVAWIRPDGVTTSDAGLMRHWEAQGLQFDPLIRALSRGVPEGST